MAQPINQRIAEWLLRRIGFVPFLWHIDDVVCCADYNEIGFVPSKERCFAVLDNARDNHNAEYGMNWDVILAELEAIKPNDDVGAS